MFEKGWFPHKGQQLQGNPVSREGIQILFLTSPQKSVLQSSNCANIFNTGLLNSPFFSIKIWAKSKNVPLGHAQTVKTQIRLHGCAVWSGPLMSSARITGYYRLYQWWAKARIRPCGCAGRCEHTFCACPKALFRLMLTTYVVSTQ